MGSVKKKLTKTLRKITPKEIAPILPLAAMMIPGLQGMSPLLRYGLPQLLTAAGSARTSGKINPLNQLMAAGASYAAGPGGMGATGKEQAFMDANTTPINTGFEAGQVDPGFGITKNLNEAGKGLDFTAKMNPEAFAKANPDKFKAFDFVRPEGSNMFAKAGDMIKPLARGYGNAIRDPFDSFGNFAKATGPGVTLAMMDQAALAQQEAEEDEAAAASANANFGGAYNDIVDSLYRMSLPENSLYNTGGRVHLANGGNGGGADRLNDARLAGFSSVAAQRRAQQAAQRSALQQYGLLGRYNNIGSGGGSGHGAERTELLRQANATNLQVRGPGIMANVAPAPRSAVPAAPVTPVTPAGPTAAEQQAAAAEAAAQAAAAEAARQVPVTMPSPNIAADPTTNTPGLITNINPTTPFTQRNPFAGNAPLNYQFIDNIFQPVVEEEAADGGRIGYADGDIVEDYEKPFNIDYGPDYRSGPLRSIANAITNMAPGDFIDKGIVNLRDLLGMETDYEEYLRQMEEVNQEARDEKNMGGLMSTRAGYNMGGMGSIPQTPNVPQGMQLEGRGGGFIPMGAQERKDDVPAMLAKNEFVMTADAVRAAGGGSVEKGAQKMYDVMNQLEAQV